jgi:hypothetical protein
MTNPNTMSNTNQLPDFSTMNKTQLEDGYRQASQEKTLDMDLINGYIKAMQQLENQPSLDTLDINDASVTKEMIRETALRDIAAHKVQLTEKDQSVTSKDQEIADLMKQLETEKNTTTQILTNDSVKDFFSLSRLRNSKLLKTLDGLKSDRQNYPKNVLIYAMGITSSKYFGAGQALKRGWAKLTWNRKSDNIKANIENLLQRCESNNNDSPIKKAMKTLLVGAVREAKEAYIKKLSTQNAF